jgi:hypothetical protein
MAAVAALQAAPTTRRPSAGLCGACGGALYPRGIPSQSPGWVALMGGGTWCRGWGACHAGTRSLLCLRPPLEGGEGVAAARHQVHGARWQVRSQ